MTDQWIVYRDQSSYSYREFAGRIGKIDKTRLRAHFTEAADAS
ncbi:MAG TPA: hypothetical protein VGC28_06040 [Sphingomonas sp.]